jgi:hypothetical protein
MEKGRMMMWALKTQLLKFSFESIANKINETASLAISSEQRISERQSIPVNHR